VNEILSRVIGSVLIRSRRGISDLYPDVIVEESHEDALQITEHPVEQGAAISDHAYVKPATVTIRGGVSDSDGSFTLDLGLGGETGERRSVEFYNKLLELQRSREPFGLVTGKRAYKNMLLESLTTVTDPNTEHVLMFAATCREVLIVATRVVSIPAGRQAKSGKTQGVKDAGQKQPQSALEAILG